MFIRIENVVSIEKSQDQVQTSVMPNVSKKYIIPKIKNCLLVISLCIICSCIFCFNKKCIHDSIFLKCCNMIHKINIEKKKEINY